MRDGLPNPKTCFLQPLSCDKSKWNVWKGLRNTANTDWVRHRNLYWFYCLLQLQLHANEKLSNVRATTVDGFQGEENTIIILSLVRCNASGKVGFLKMANRACVALSRAKNGKFSYYENPFCLIPFHLLFNNLAEIDSLWFWKVFFLCQYVCSAICGKFHDL